MTEHDRTFAQPGDGLDYIFAACSLSRRFVHHKKRYQPGSIRGVEFTVYRPACEDMTLLERCRPITDFRFDKLLAPAAAGGRFDQLLRAIEQTR